MEAGGEPGLGAMKITPSRTARLDGFFAMNIDYRLVNSTFAPACYQDMYTAIRWVHVHAAEYHIDTSRICLMGNSSAATKSLSLRLSAKDRMEKPADGTRNLRISALPSASPAPTISTRCPGGNLWTPVAGSATTGFTTLAGAALEEARRIARPCKISVRELSRCCP